MIPWTKKKQLGFYFYARAQNDVVQHENKNLQAGCEYMYTLTMDLPFLLYFSNDLR